MRPLVLLLLLAACGGGSEPDDDDDDTAASGAITGTVDGRTLDPVLEVVFAYSRPEGRPAYGDVLLGSVTGLCEKIWNPSASYTADVVGLSVIHAGGALVPGTYPVVLGASELEARATASHLRFLAGGTGTTETPADGGVVEVLEVSDQDLRGTFELALVNGDTLTGAFDADVYCPELETGR